MREGAHAAEASHHRWPPTATDRDDLVQISPRQMPDTHPVRLFGELHHRLSTAGLLPHEQDLFAAEEMMTIFEWSEVLEPIEIDSRVNFKIVRQGERTRRRGRRRIDDTWLTDPTEPGGSAALYHEAMAVAVLRRPLYSKAREQSGQRSLVFVYRGVFPIFSDNEVRLRLICVRAEPYVQL